jgi:hypothetical protein
VFAPESPRPILAVPTKPVGIRQTNRIETRTEDLVREARRLGMSEARIAERFGAGLAKEQQANKVNIKMSSGKSLSLADLGL